MTNSIFHSHFIIFVFYFSVHQIPHNQKEVMIIPLFCKMDFKRVMGVENWCEKSSSKSILGNSTRETWRTDIEQSWPFGNLLEHPYPTFPEYIPI